MIAVKANHPFGAGTTQLDSHAQCLRDKLDCLCRRASPMWSSLQVERWKPVPNASCSNDDRWRKVSVLSRTTVPCGSSVAAVGFTLRGRNRIRFLKFEAELYVTLQPYHSQTHHTKNASPRVVMSTTPLVLTSSNKLSIRPFALTTPINGGTTYRIFGWIEWDAES